MMFPKRQMELGEEILKVEGLTACNRFADVSFTLRRGEILGITGLLGSGAKNLIRTLFGLEQAQSGRIEVAGKAGRLHTARKRQSIGSWHWCQKTGAAMGWRSISVSRRT
jgi:ribose transport system ATP-binding protein